MKDYDIEWNIKRLWNHWSFFGKPFAILEIIGFLTMVLLDGAFIC